MYVSEIGDCPGVWHQDSIRWECRTLKFAFVPIPMIPSTMLPLFMVVAGFLVEAANASNGSTPMRCAAREPAIGIESDWQFGLKSDAKLHAHSFPHIVLRVASDCYPIHRVYRARIPALCRQPPPWHVHHHQNRLRDRLYGLQARPPS